MVRKTATIIEHIAEFTSDIRHISGLFNVVVDSLSRPSQPSKCSKAEGLMSPPIGSDARRAPTHLVRNQKNDQVHSEKTDLDVCS